MKLTRPKQCAARGAIAGMAMLLAATVAVGQQRGVPRAVPVEEPPPRAVPVDPVAPKAQPVTDPNRPSGPDEDLYEFATLCFTQQDYKVAIKPYTEYTTSYPQGRHAAEAWFRLGECYRKTGQQKEALVAYNETINRHPKSEGAGFAAYRLGSAAYEARDYANGTTWFQMAESLSKAPEIKLAATFNKGLCLKYSGQKAKALTAFKTVAASKSATMFKEIDISLQEIATTAIELNQKEDALAAFNQILESSRDPKVLADAQLRSGLLLSDMGKGDEALKALQKAIANQALTASQRGAAVFGLIRGAFAKNDFDQVIKTYADNASVAPPPDLLPKQLLIVGMAYKHLKNYRQAIEVFLLLEKECAEADEAIEAGYQKLLCFYQLNDKDMPLFTERFEERYGTKYRDHDYIQMARLIRADWWFHKTDYKKAAEAFVGVEVGRVPEKVRASVIYKKGFAESEAEKWSDGISTLSRFIADYPKDANIPVALAQRGVCYRATRAFDKALADFGRIIKDHDGHQALELALYQSGMIKSDSRDFAGAVTDLEALLKKFPSTPAAATAWYTLGRTYFELQTKESFGKALEPLRKAIALDPKVYLEKASQLLIHCQHLREDVDGLAKEVDAYRERNKNGSVSPKALLFLGVNFFQRANYQASAKYLEMASTPNEPQSTDPMVWNYLGQAEYENGRHDAAVTALNHYLNQTPSGGGRATALLHKGKALLALKNHSEADACAKEGLDMVKEGKLHAQFQMLQGDIAEARGDALAQSGEQGKASAVPEWQKAAATFIAVSQFFVDPEITPEAAYKAIRVMDKLGDKTRAEALRQQLKAKYPNYQPKG